MGENAGRIINIRKLEADQAGIQSLIDSLSVGCSGSLTQKIDGLTCSENYCWYDDNTGKVVISSRAPNKNCDLVVADIGDAASPAILEKLAELYAIQQRDDFNPDYRKDSGTYNDKDKRSARIDHFDREKPAGLTVNKLNPNISLLFYQDPNKPPRTVEESSPSSRKPFFMALQTPDRFKYSTLIMGNHAAKGLLHALLRHGDQFGQLDLSIDIMSILPKDMLELAKIIRRNNSMNARWALQDRLTIMEQADYQKMLELQFKLHKAIQKLFQYDNYLGESVNNSGQLQVFWRVDANTVMVTAMSEQLLQGESSISYDGSGKKRPLRTIITTFLMPMKDFLSKKDKGPVKRSN